MKHFIFVVNLILLTSSGAQAKDVDIDTLIYLTEEYEPYNYEEKGQLKGIAVDLLKLMWKQTGYPEQKIDVVPWARGYKQLQEMPNTVLFATARTKERENLFKWVCPITTNKYVLIAKRERKIKIQKLVDAKKYTIGTIREDVAEQILLNENFEKETETGIESVATMTQNLGKLARNRIDLIAYGEESTWRYMKENGYNPEDFETVYTLKESQICYAFHKETPNHLVQRLQKSLDVILKETIYEELLDRYFRN